MDKIKTIGKLAIWRTGQSVKWLFIGLVLGELACFPRWWVKQKIQTLHTHTHTQNKLYFYYNSLTPSFKYDPSLVHIRKANLFHFPTSCSLRNGSHNECTFPPYPVSSQITAHFSVKHPWKFLDPKIPVWGFLSSLRATEMLSGADSTSLYRREVLHQLQLQCRMSKCNAGKERWLFLDSGGKR